MKTKRVSERTVAEIDLARRLSECPSINRYDDGEHKEAWALAHALHDIDESARLIADRLLPALKRPDITDTDIEDVLLDVGEELREILYHIRNLRYYDYIAATESDRS